MTNASWSLAGFSKGGGGGGGGVKFGISRNIKGYLILDLTNWITIGIL